MFILLNLYAHSSHLTPITNIFAFSEEGMICNFVGVGDDRGYLQWSLKFSFSIKQRASPPTVFAAII